MHPNRQSLWYSQASQRTHSTLGPAVQLHSNRAPRRSGQVSSPEETNSEWVRVAPGHFWGWVCAAIHAEKVTGARPQYLQPWPSAPQLGNGLHGRWSPLLHWVSGFLPRLEMFGVCDWERERGERRERERERVMSRYCLALVTLYAGMIFFMYSIVWNQTILIIETESTVLTIESLQLQILLFWCVSKRWGVGGYFKLLMPSLVRVC